MSGHLSLVFRPCVLGAILIVLGIPGLLDSSARFALQGIGTPAPVFPTLHLVVKGFYHYVRNPIYLAVVSVILGQGIILGNVNLLTGEIRPSRTK
jgi:protein-S-isoprenylcysteine O-methyltransferase Ste14